LIHKRCFQNYNQYYNKYKILIYNILPQKFFLTCYVVRDSELKLVKYHCLLMDRWVDYDPMIIISLLTAQLVIVLLDLSYLPLLPILPNWFLKVVYQCHLHLFRKIIYISIVASLHLYKLKLQLCLYFKIAIQRNFNFRCYLLNLW